MAERYDAIVVGAGPAGNAAALTLASAGSRVLQLERSKYPGAGNARGAILGAAALDELIPDFRQSAPLERRIVEQRVWTLDARSHVATHFEADADSGVRDQRYTVLRAPFDAWLSSIVAQAGVRVACATTVTDLIREPDGRVIGVRIEGGDEFFADIVVLGDGIEALVARSSGLRDDLQPLQVALSVKELRLLPRAAIEERFGISGDDGVILEAAGSPLRGTMGFGFIHTHRESLSVGVGCLVSAVIDNDVTPSELLDSFKRHPSIQPLLQDSETVSSAAQLFPEGGYRSRPRLFGDGWLTCGDASQMYDARHREGATMALTSGRLAAETIVELTRHGRPMTARHLSLYRDKLERSPVLRDLHDRRRLATSSLAAAADPRHLAEAAGTLIGPLQGPLHRKAQMGLLQRMSNGLTTVGRWVGETA